MSKKKIFFIAVGFSLSLLSWSCASLFGRHTCASSQKFFSEPNFNLYVTQYKNNDPTKKTIIIIPPTGGTNFIDKRYADEFCSAGYDVLVLNSWTLPSKPGSVDLQLHQRDYERSEASIGRLIKEIKTPFIGILGTSLGAMYAAAAINSLDGIDAGFLIAGGVPITEVIATSDQELMQELKTKRKVKFGFNNTAAYISMLQKEFFLEPMKLGEKHKAVDLGISIALADDTVPTQLQKNLVDFFKPKKIIEYNSSHFWGIAKTWLFSSGEIVTFFEESSKKHIH